MIDTKYYKALVLALSVGFVAGCSTTGETQGEGATGGDVQPVDQEGGGAAVSAGAGESGGVSAEELEAEKEAAAQEAQERQQAALREVRTVYFDFDKSEIRAESRDVLMAHAAYLQANPDARVVLEGHADERGTKEYNLALGERRAKAVARFLTVNGASDSQIDPRTLGEEEPAVMGNTEEAYAKNRRVEIVYQ